MLQKSVIILVVACFVHVKAYEPDEELYKELSQAGLQVAAVIRRGLIKVGETYVSIENSITEFEHVLAEQATNLTSIVDQAKEDAANTGKDIAACLQKEEDGIKGISALKFEMCRASGALNQLTARLIALVEQEGVLAQSVSTCSSLNRTVFKHFKNCVKDIIAQVLDEVKTAEDQIQSFPVAALEHANTCAVSESYSIQEAIDDVTTNFENCIKHA